MYLFKIITPSDRTEDKLEITRWVVKTELGEHTWDELISRLQKLFRTRSSQFFVSWFDGMDYCTIRDWQDLQESVEFFAGTNNGNDTAVRIFASPDKKEHHTIFGQRPPQDNEMTPSLSSVVESNEDDQILEDLNYEDQLAEVAALTAEVTKNVKLEDEFSEVNGEVEDQPSGVSTPIQTNETPDPSHTVPPMGYPAYPYMAPNYVPYAAQTPNQPMYPVMMQQWPMQPMHQFAPLDSAEQIPPSEVKQQNPFPIPTVSTSNAQEPITATVPVESKIPPPRPSEPVVKITPGGPKQSPSTGHAKGAKKVYIQLAMDKLRSMGFTQDDKTLKRLIKSKKGNLNEIIDILNSN